LVSFQSEDANNAIKLFVLQQYMVSSRRMLIGQNEQMLSSFDLVCLFPYLGSRDSSLRVPMGYGPGGRGIGALFLSGPRDFNPLISHLFSEVTFAWSVNYLVIMHLVQ
jgi:hypothetical protein